MRRLTDITIGYRGKKLDFDLEAIENDKQNPLNDERYIRKLIKEKNKKLKEKNKKLKATDKIENKESKDKNRKSTPKKKIKTIDNMTYDELVHYATMLGLTFPEDIDIEELNLMIIKAGG